MVVVDGWGVRRRAVWRRGRLRRVGCWWRVREDEGGRGVAVGCGMLDAVRGEEGCMAGIVAVRSASIPLAGDIGSATTSSSGAGMVIEGRGCSLEIVLHSPFTSQPTRHSE